MKALVKEFKEMNTVMKGAVCYCTVIILATVQFLIETLAK